MTTTALPERELTRPDGGVHPVAASRDATRMVVAVAAWVALIAVSVVWGNHIVAIGRRVGIAAPPLTGSYGTRANGALLIPAALALLVIGPGLRVARTARWEVLLALVMVTAVGWAIALGLNDGWHGLTDPLLPNHYVGTVPLVGNPLTFLRTFTRRLPNYNIDTQGHPPGMVLILWVMDRIGLGGTGPNLVLVLGGGAAGIAAVLVSVRDVAGESAARACAPFVVLAPAALWWSSGDALFLGVSAWAVTLVVLATGHQGRRADQLALAGGLLFGATAMLSYGLVLLAAIPIAVAVARHRVRPLVIAAVGGAIVLVGFLAAGFWWLAGLAATRIRYFAGIASRRPYWYFLVGNLGAFALAVGPAVALGLARLRDRRVWLLVAAALTAVALADLSGMSKAEVERIWLPFAPWVLLATASLGALRMRASWVRVVLGAQVAVALAIQAAVRSPW